MTIKKTGKRLRNPGSEDALAAAARDDFVTFCEVCFTVLHHKKPLQRNWHIRAIAHQLDRVKRGEEKRLIVSLPPRHLKSFIISVAYPAFLLGHDPSLAILVASYSSKLAIKHGDDFRALIGSSTFKRIFPGFAIGHKNSEAEVTTSLGGGRLSTSVEGPVTGRGCDIAIIDDPLTPEDALSDARREAANRWFFNTLLSRLNDPEIAPLIIVMQRLHQNDLAGELLRRGGWHHLKLPAFATQDEDIPIGPKEIHRRNEGDALHSERMSAEFLAGRRELLGADLWQAQYQQDPVAPGGNMIKREWIQRYDKIPDRQSDTIIVQSIDTAIKGGETNDYSVITTWQVQGHINYLIDVARARLDYAELKDWVLRHAVRHSPSRILIEDAGLGMVLVQELANTSWSVIGVKPITDKLTRVQAVTPKFRTGKVYLPQQASWLADFETELCAFPQARYDDQVDSVSQFLLDPTSTYDPFAVTDFMSELVGSSLNQHIMRHANRGVR